MCILKMCGVACFGSILKFEFDMIVCMQLTQDTGNLAKIRGLDWLACNNYEKTKTNSAIRSHKSQSQQFLLQKNFLNITSCLLKVQRGMQLTAVQIESRLWDGELLVPVCKQVKQKPTPAWPLLTRNSLSIICQHLSHRHMWWAPWPTPLHSVM